MPKFPLSEAAFLEDVVILNRAIYGGNLELPDTFLDDYDPARDPSNAGIRPALNVYDRYDTYLQTFGLTTLGATELGFTPAEMSADDDFMPGDGQGVEMNWFYDGDLYRNHHVLQSDGSTIVFQDAAAIALTAIKEEGASKTLHLVFRGTDADLGSDGEAGTGPGQIRYYGQLEMLIDKVRAYTADTANGITDVVISGQSLGGAMVDMFALYDGAAFDAIPGVNLHAIALASAGVDPATLAGRTDFDTSLVSTDGSTTTFVTPDWYSQYDNFDDIVRNPERYDLARHTQADPQQAPITRAATSTLLEHINFEENRLEIELPEIDQYALSASFETTFLPQHYASTYELAGLGLAQAAVHLDTLDFDRIIALGGINPNITETSGTNNVNGFLVPEDDVADFSAETDTLLILGLSGDDTITAGLGGDVLVGGEGNDTLNGNIMAESLFGDDGDDVLNGGMGADMLNGGSGVDLAQYTGAIAAVRADLVLSGANTGEAAGDIYTSIENLYGSAHDDVLLGNGAGNIIWGDDGNDRIFGRSGDDELFGMNGNDVLIGASGADMLDGGNDDDILNGGLGADELNGGSGVDVAQYTGAAAALRVDLALSGTNTGEAAGDTYISIENLYGSAHDYVLLGDGDRNVLWGDDGNDRIFGRDGNDSLFGMNGDDVLIGGNDDDILNGGTGTDTLNGGSGVDRAQYTGATVGVRADLQLSGTNSGEAAGDTYILIENLYGSAHDDVLLGDGAGNRIWGDKGNDWVFGRDGNDALLGMNGDDVLVGGSGADTLSGGNDNDTLNGGTGADTLNGGSGVDLAQYTDAIAALRADLQVSGTNTGEAAGDTYISIENLHGSAHDDVLLGDGARNTLFGADGNDRIFGRDGNDVLLGMKGDDVLVGGTGADVFIFQTAGDNDLITDFEDGIDTIRVLTGGISSFADLTITDAAGGAIVDYGSGIVQVKNIAEVLLTNDDFLFV